MKVKDAMHKGAVWVEASTPVSEVAKKMKAFDIGAIPVGENDRLVGIITDRDITVRCVSEGKDCSQIPAKEIMTEGVVYCNEEEDLADAVRIMEQRKIRRLPVLNNDKRLVGMLSIDDIAHAAPQSLTAEVMSAVSVHHS